MKLIRELTESVEYLTEEKDGKKTLYIEGPFLVAEAVNKNKRMYKEETMRNEVNRYNEEYISKIVPLVNWVTQTPHLLTLTVYHT